MAKGSYFPGTRQPLCARLCACVLFCVGLLGGGLAIVHPAGAQDLTPSSKGYPDGHGGEVTFPMGDQSFVDEIAAQSVGDPDGAAFSERPEALIGPPQFENDGARSVYTLGCGGTVDVAFLTNTLIDIPGRDLYVFEVGRDIEAMAVAVSQDGASWTRVGVVSGGNASLDIGPYTPPGAHYRYVRLVDLEEVCSGRTPGADVDAIGAIGAATRLQVDSAVLFDTDDATLKDNAFAILDDIIDRIPNPRQTQIEVLGHTDNTGTASYNQELSERRAETVARYLRRESGLLDERVVPRGYGEARPIASNSTADGRRQNRRVEFNVRTLPAPADTVGVVQEVLGVWSTSEYGILEMQQRLDSGRVFGSYSETPRNIIGEFTGETVFEGIWTQPRSPYTCETAQGGYQHWGRVRMEFESAQREVFTGSYSYCDEPPGENAFDGRRML